MSTSESDLENSFPHLSIWTPKSIVLTPEEAIYAQIKAVELAGRTCYKSEDKVTSDSHEKFIRAIISRNHESVLEHTMITVKVVTNLGVARELERHRHSVMIGDHCTALSQESTRYVNQGKEKFGRRVSVCLTDMSSITPEQRGELLKAYDSAAEVYLKLSEQGVKPDVLRSVLPLVSKTEMVISCSVREWRAILKLRLSKAAHSDMRELMKLVYNDFMKLCPLFFEDIIVPE